MEILSFANFKDFVISLVTAIISKSDAKSAEFQTRLDALSADLTVANATITELRGALASADQAKVDALATQAAEQISALDALSTELAESFNPSNTADVVAEIVLKEPTIDVPAVVEDSTEVGTGEPTPQEVTEAAVEAVAVAAEVGFGDSEGDLVAGE